VHRTTGSYMEKLKNVPHKIETEVTEAGHAIRDDAGEIGHRAKRAMSPRSGHNDDEDEDEGWASDRSATQQPNESIPITDGKKQGKSPKLKSLPKPVGKGRRRSSMRKGMLGRAHILKLTQPESSSVFEDSDGEGTDAHGHREIVIAEPVDGLVSRGSGRSLRFDSISGIDARREDSPVRSI